MSNITSFPITPRSLYGPYYYDIRDYASGSQLTGGSDATEAVQTVLDAIQTAAITNGGGTYTLDIGDSVLRVDGGLNTRNGSNSQLILPSLGLGVTPPTTLHIKGNTPKPAIFGTVGYGVALPANGGVFISTLTTGGGTQPSVISGRAPNGNSYPFSMLYLVFENVEIRTVSNPLISGLDAELLAGFEMIESVVTPGVYNVDAVIVPTTAGSTGVIAPKVNNGVLINFHNASVLGFYNGFRLNEHAQGDIQVFGCINAVVATPGFHSIHMSRIEDVANRNGIVSSGGTIRIKVDAWIIEQETTGNFVRIADVVDSGNYLVGSATWSVVVGYGGISHVLTKIGGTNFSTTEYGTASGSGLGGTTGAVANAILRANGGGGATVQSSLATITDAGIVNSVAFWASDPDNPTQMKVKSNHAGQNAGYVFVVNDAGGNQRAAGIYFRPVTSADDSYVGIAANNIDYHFKVRGDGQVVIPGLGSGTVVSDASGNLSVTSDARLKVVGSNFTRGLEDLVKITPKFYRWNDASGLETEHDYAGLIAQDVEAAIPEAVGRDPKGMRTLSDRALIAALINAVKELNAEVHELKAKK